MSHEPPLSHDIYRQHVERVRASSDIRDVISSRISMNGAKMARCPFHDDRTPSLSINDGEQYFYCFGCGVGGDVFTFVERIENVGFAEAVEILASRAGIPPHRASELERREAQRPREIQEVLTETAHYYHSRLTAGAQAYLIEQRHLSIDVINRFLIGWADGSLRRHLLEQRKFSVDLCHQAGVLKQLDDGTTRDFFYERLVFPNLLRGRVVHITGRTMGDGEPKYLHLPGKITHLYNEEALGCDEPIVVEGPLDVLSLETWGMQATALLGTATRNRIHPAVFARTSKVFVCLDGDVAGQKSALRTAKAIGSNARIVQLPPGQDPNDFLRRGDRTALEKLIHEARDVLTYQIEQIPTDTPRTELPAQLKAIVEQLAAIDRATAEAFISSMIRNRFQLRDADVREYRAMVKRCRKKTASQTGVATAINGSNDFIRDERGQPTNSQHNIRVALMRMGCVLAHDVFADRLLCNGKHMGDAEVTHLYLQTEELFGFRPAKEYYWMVVEEAARANPQHPVREYLGALQWDGSARLDTWMATYLGAPDTEYTRIVGAIVPVAAVRRVRQPGCKFDEMLVLESGQGTAKSTALGILGVRDEWFSDDLALSADTKRQMEALAGRWIVEAGELRGMRKGDVEHLKSFLSRRVDRARLAYGRLTTEAPRQCVIIGTTNSDRYLRDSTGNRRFWPVAVGQIDLAALKRDRDQLWAEAAVREAEGMSIRLAPELWPVAGNEQEDRRIEDPMFERLEKHLADQEGKIPASRVWDITGVLPGQRQQEHNVRLGEAMKRLGFTRETMRFSGASEKGYWRIHKDAVIEILGVEPL